MIPAVTITAMYADYASGLSLTEVGRRHGGRHQKTVRKLFVSRGLAVRSAGNYTKERRENGSFAPDAPKTPAEIDALVAAAERIGIPHALRIEWRHWSMERRAEFVARVRAKLASPRDRPETPFSSNVMPFGYGTRRAHEIRIATHGIRQRGGMIKLCSQGVIWSDELWFWVYGTGYVTGPWTPEQTRLLLHREIYAAHHGIRLAPRDVIRHADGNWNNLDPSNLILMDRNDLCCESQAKALLSKSRDQTALIFQRSQSNHESDTLQRLRRPARRV